MNLVWRRWDGFCIVERLSDALEAFRFSRSSLSHSTHSSTLQPYIDFDARKEGESVRVRPVARSLPHNRVLDTGLVVYHAKVGDLRSARFIFDGMPEKNVVSWTALISGYSQNGLFKEALETFGLMHREGSKANQLTYGSALSACSRIGCIWAGLQIQGCIAKSRYTKDLCVNSALVDLHLKYGLVEDAQTLFWGVDYRDTVLWNSMIGGLASRCLTDDTFKFFFLMLKQGKLPDHFTFPSILRACSVARDVLNIDKIHSMIIKSGLSSHHIVSGSLIDAYVKCRSIPRARLLYDSLLEQDIFPCTTLIAGYSTDRSYSNEAVKLYCKINQVGVKVDNVIICSMLNVSANESSLDLGRQIHACAIKSQLNHDVALQNSLVHMYAESGELQLAQLAFDEMQTTNVISWTSLIAGYGKHGQVDDVVTLFENMENTGVKPNDVTFLSLISSCSHSGLISKGLEFYDLMINKYAIQPRVKHFSCIVDLLGRGGLLDEAYNFVRVMSVKPTASVWGAMLGACGIHGNRFLGEVAAGYLLNLYPQQSVNYIVLSNIYAATGLWENAWRTRKLMEQKSRRKDAGCSYICVDNVYVTFTL